MSATLEAHLSRYEGVRRNNVRAALMRYQGLNGKYFPRYECAEIIACGEYVQIDRNAGRVYTSKDGRFFLIADLTKTLVDYLEYLIYTRYAEGQ